MGERMIRQLRSKKEESDGSEFDVREFHADYLACLGFLDELEECVAEREAERRSPGGKARMRAESGASRTTTMTAGMLMAVTWLLMRLL